jgi:DNA-binding transcriptional regulator YdaS (Cro superfamily)
VTAAAFRAHLGRLCWTQRGLAVLLGLSHNTVHRWALDQAAIPPATAAWLEQVAAFIERHPPPRSR